MHDRGSNFWDISFNVSNSIVERIFFSWRFLPNISTELSSDLNIIIVILQKYTFITWLLQWCILVHFEARLFAPWEIKIIKILGKKYFFWKILEGCLKVTLQTCVLEEEKSASVDGGPSGVSRVRRAGSEDSHRH